MCQSSSEKNTQQLICDDSFGLVIDTVQKNYQKSLKSIALASIET